MTVAVTTSQSCKILSHGIITPCVEFHWNWTSQSSFHHLSGTWRSMLILCCPVQYHFGFTMSDFLVSALFLSADFIFQFLSNVQRDCAEEEEVRPALRMWTSSPGPSSICNRGDSRQLFSAPFRKLPEIISCPRKRQMHLLALKLLLSFFIKRQSWSLRGHILLACPVGPTVLSDCPAGPLTLFKQSRAACIGVMGQNKCPFGNL